MYTSTAFLLLLLALGDDVLGQDVLADDEDSGRIVGGEATSINLYPYQVSLQFNKEHVCGGSIISDAWIVTAAHCVQGSFVRYISVKAGATQLSDDGTVIGAARIIVHEKYDRGTSDYDIALIRLKKRLHFGPGIQPITIPPFADVYGEGRLATVSGWGYLKPNGTPTNQLRKVDVPLISSSVCSQLYKPRAITPRMLCAGYVNAGGRDACQGDSGGPLAQNGMLIGIVSWGFSCADPLHPGVYTRVEALRSWIKNRAGI